MQGGDKAVSYSGVVVDELGQRGETALRCHIHLGGRARKAADVEVGEKTVINKVG